MAGARRKNRLQPNLTAERVRDEALRLIEAEGLSEFSTRKLGRALGVEAMAIYWYYPSKEKLLDAVVDLLISEISDLRPARPNDDFIGALRKLAHAYRGLAHAYPRAFPLLATRRFATERTYGFLEGLFMMARANGLDPRATARWYRLVASYCSGVALDELASLREREEEDDAAKERARFPRVATVFGWLEPDHFDDVFSFGLEVLLKALASGTSSSDASSKTASRRGMKAKSSSKRVADPRPAPAKRAPARA